MLCCCVVRGRRCIWTTCWVDSVRRAVRMLWRRLCTKLCTTCRTSNTGTAGHMLMLMLMQTQSDGCRSLLSFRYVVQFFFQNNEGCLKKVGYYSHDYMCMSVYIYMGVSIFCKKWRIQKVRNMTGQRYLLHNHKQQITREAISSSYSGLMWSFNVSVNSKKHQMKVFIDPWTHFSSSAKQKEDCKIVTRMFIITENSRSSVSWDTFTDMSLCVTLESWKRYCFAFSEQINKFTQEAEQERSFWQQTVRGNKAFSVKVWSRNFLCVCVCVQLQTVCLWSVSSVGSSPVSLPGGAPLLQQQPQLLPPPQPHLQTGNHSNHTSDTPTPTGNHSNTQPSVTVQ